MKLYLHIGAHKTGTTSLQNALSECSHELAAAGVCYPNSYDGRNGHHDLAHSIRTKYQLDVTLKYYKDIFQSCDNMNFLISSEEFEFFSGRSDFELLKNLFSDFDVKILFWARRQDELLEAEYSQHVMMKQVAYKGSLTDFFFRYDFRWRLNFFRICNLWSSYFGAENVSVRVFDRDYLKNGSSVDDCLDAIGCSELSIINRKYDDNRSLYGACLEIVRSINQLECPEDVRDTVIQWLSNEKKCRKFQKTLSEENRKDFMNYFESSNANISDKYKLGHEWYR